MSKVNKKLSVKIQILMERLQKVKEREKREGFLPVSKIMEGHSRNKEELVGRAHCGQ